MLLIVSVIFAGCRTDDIEPPTPEPPPTENIVVADKESLEQTVYADEEVGESTVQFTTTAPWDSSIDKVATSQSTRNVTTNWITITPESGGVGDYEIKLTLEQNRTGADRTVIITITNGGETIEIRITQRYVREDGTTHYFAT